LAMFVINIKKIFIRTIIPFSQPDDGFHGIYNSSSLNLLIQIGF